METYLDALTSVLAAAVPGISWIIGDWGMSTPTANGLPLPIGYITPYDDQILPRTAGQHGYDMDVYTTPIFIVDDLQNYGPPVDSPANSYMEQPGYRKLIEYADQVRAALRANITLTGVIATAKITSIRYTPLPLDGVQYRAARLTVEAQQRVFR